MLSTKDLPTDKLPFDLTEAGSFADDVVDAATTQAMELATDVVVPAAKVAIVKGVWAHRRLVLVGLALAVIVPFALKWYRDRNATDDQHANRSNATSANGTADTADHGTDTSSAAAKTS